MPFPTITKRDLETLVDAYAYLLATDSRTANVSWVIGDVGMGKPGPLPFGYISVLSEAVGWYTAQGGVGGLAAGLDDWQIPIVLTVAIEPHNYIPFTAAAPPAASPFSAANLGAPPPYSEQPGWRVSLDIVQNIKKVMRTNSNVGGAATDTHIVESRFVLAEIDEKLYRAARMTIQTQQRRIRGD